ncbi:MAG: hypothetical protein ACRDY7_07445 [Acidimicrobiia bacterium]
MTDAAYVIGGWVITGAALSGYAARLWLRTRRLRSLVPPPEEPGEDAGWT